TAVQDGSGTVEIPPQVATGSGLFALSLQATQTGTGSAEVPPQVVGGTGSFTAALSATQAASVLSSLFKRRSARARCRLIWRCRAAARACCSTGSKRRALAIV